MYTVVFVNLVKFISAKPDKVHVPEIGLLNILIKEYSVV